MARSERVTGVTVIIWTSVALSIALWVLASRDIRWVSFFALHPDSIASGEHIQTLVTHIFVHATLLHLFVNMFVLSNLGPLCERIVGRRMFLRFYLFAGIWAGALSAALSLAFGRGWGERVFGGPEIYLLGGSGAIFAIAGFFVVVLPRLRFSIIFLPFWAFPAYIMVPVVLLATWAFSIVGDFPIGNAAHAGGFLAGLVFGLYAKRQFRGRIQWIESLARRR